MACLCVSVLTSTPPSYDDDNDDAAGCWMTDTYGPFISLFACWLDDIHCYWPPVLLHLIMLTLFSCFFSCLPFALTSTPFPL